VRGKKGHPKNPNAGTNPGVTPRRDADLKETAMQIDNQYRLEKLVNPEDETERLRYIQIKNNTAAACTRSAIAIVPCAVGAGDIEGPIILDSLLHARSLNEKFATIHLADHQTVVTRDSSVFPRSSLSEAHRKDTQLEFNRETPEHNMTPAILDTVIPRREDSDLCIHIDARLLWDLAQAIGCKDKIMTMRIHSDQWGHPVVSGPIRVDGYENAYGVIATCRGEA